VTPGTEFIISAAIGQCFYVSGRSQQPLLLVGSGSGLAPLYGIARSALAQGHEGDIWLYHGSHTVEGLLFFGVPAMYYRLLEVQGGPDVSSIRLWVCGSAPLDRGLAERFERRFGQRIVNRYGMTETAMITANPAQGERKFGSVGPPLPEMDVRVIDPVQGAERAIGEVGEIVVRGPSVADHYWGGMRDEATRQVNGYFRTGDLGYRDAEGYFYLTGRAKDIIISGGTNIAPAEIEEVLLRHPKVAEAVALPIPDPALGEVVRAVVVCGTGVEAEELKEWCEGNLAKYKCPREIRLTREPLPRNAMHKLDRMKAKELYGH
jgi:malonyl-CoA/methylmalonyl-CoA synthetase